MILIDGYVEWLEGFEHFTPDPSWDYVLQAFGPSLYFVCDPTPEQIAARNASIRKAWECPDRRERQRLKVVADRAAVPPEVQAERKAKQSKTAKATYSDPEKRKAISDRKKAWWTPERRAELSVRKTAEHAAKHRAKVSR